MNHQEIAHQLERLKTHLADGLAIYHERVTLLIQITHFEIQETRVGFRAGIIKPLDRQHAESSPLYHHMTTLPEIKFGASFFIGTDKNTAILNGNKLGRAYCPFILWLNPELAKFVLENEDEVTRQIPGYLLTNRDWKILKLKN